MVDLLISRGFAVRVIDNLNSGLEANLGHIRGSADLVAEWRDVRSLAPDDPLFSGAKYVFHFAGVGDIVPSIEKPLEYMGVNSQGTVHVLEAARSAGVKKFVYAASSSCYGLATVPTREDHPIDPKYPYALSKYLGEQSSLHWYQVYGLPVNSVRIFNAYGTRSRTSGVYGAVFGVFLRQKLAGRPFTVVGDGTQTRDFVYATDVATGFLAAAETNLAGQVYNLGSGTPNSINRLVELLGGDVELIARRPGEPDCTWADITKIKTDLGWQTCVNFEDGVARILADIEYWRAAPLWDAKSIAEATQKWFDTLS